MIAVSMERPIRALRRPTGPWLWLAVMLVPLLVGCGGPTRTDTQRNAAASYEQGQYERALRQAEIEARRASGLRRDEAYYLAGLSAYRLGRGEQAIDHLARATRSRDDTLAAEAHATLGLIHAGRRNDTTARRHLQAAVDDLRGPDRAQVHYQLGRIDQRAGRWASARSHLSIALSLSDDAHFRRVIRQHMAAEGFTLQFGAYSDRARARRQAADLRRTAQRLRTAYPEVVPSVTESGRTLYLVQMGRFTTEAQARRAAERSGEDDVFVVPAG